MDKSWGRGTANINSEPGRKSWAAEESRQQAQSQDSQVMGKEELFPGTQRSLYRAAVSQEADGACQNPDML